MEIANLLDIEFRPLVIRVLREIIQYSHKIKEEMKFTQSEIKIYREPTVKGRKPGFKSTIWSTRKK